jgi:hypothetical protein
MASSAYSLTMVLPAGGFEVIAGEPVPGGLTRDHHFFCPSCMSWMFTRPPQMDFLVNLRPTMLDEPHWVVPFVEFFTAERLPWAVTPARHSYERVPEMDAFAGLVKEFAADGARP